MIIRVPGPRGRSSAHFPSPTAGPSRPRATSICEALHHAQQRVSLEARPKGSGSSSEPVRISTPPWAGDSFSKYHAENQARICLEGIASWEHEDLDRPRAADDRPVPQRPHGGLYLQYPVYAPAPVAHVLLQPPPPPTPGRSHTVLPPRLCPVEQLAPPEDVVAHTSAPPPPADWQRDRDQDRGRARTRKVSPPSSLSVWPPLSRADKRRRCSGSADTRRVRSCGVARPSSTPSGYFLFGENSAPPRLPQSRARSPPHTTQRQRAVLPPLIPTCDSALHTGSTSGFDHAIRIEHSLSPMPVSYNPPLPYTEIPATARRLGDEARTRHPATIARARSA